jgi:hypothetical protein
MYPNHLAVLRWIAPCVAAILSVGTSSLEHAEHPFTGAPAAAAALPTIT